MTLAVQQHMDKLMKQAEPEDVSPAPAQAHLDDRFTRREPEGRSVGICLGEMGQHNESDATACQECLRLRKKDLWSLKREGPQAGERGLQPFRLIRMDLNLAGFQFPLTQPSCQSVGRRDCSGGEAKGGAVGRDFGQVMQRCNSEELPQLTYPLQLVLHMFDPAELRHGTIQRRIDELS